MNVGACHVRAWVLLGLSAALVCALAQAQAPNPTPEWLPPDVAGQRARVAAEQARLDQRYREAREACYQKFAVTACLNAAHQQDRAERAQLRQLKLNLSDSERQQHAESALQRQARKQTAQQDRAETTPSSARKAMPDADGPPASAPTPEHPRSPAAPGLEQAEAEDELGPARAPQRSPASIDLARKRQEAQAHKAERLRKNETAKKPAAGLPVPP